MRRKDFLLGWAWAAPILALLAPACLDPRAALRNFGDLYAYHYPLRHLTAGALQSGRMPFWNAYIFAGLPLAANPQSVLFYPVSLFGAIFPLTLAFSWDYAFHLLWAALGMALLARRLRASAAAAALLAAAYSLSPFLIYRVTEGIPTLLASLAWCPWCWLALDSGFSGLLAAVWSLQLLSGHPQFMLVNAMGMAAWVLIDGRAGLAALTRMLKEAAAAAALTAVQWAPMWEFVGRSVRRGWPAVFTAAYSIDARSLWTWLYPNAWGNPLDGSYLGPPSVFFETAAPYIGIMGLALAAAGLWSGRRRAAAAALIGLGVLLAAGPNNALAAVLLKRGPLALMRTPSRYLLLSLWGLAAAAGAGWKWLEGEGRAPARLRGGLAAALILELLVWDRRFVRAEKAAPYLGVNRELARAAGGQPWRVMTDPELANPDKAMLYRAMNVNGYEAFYLAGFAEYAAKSEGRPAADPSRSYLRRFDSREMDRLGVAFYLSSAGKLIRNPAALPLAYFVDSSGGVVRHGVSLVIDSPEEWTVRGFAPAAARGIVFALPYYPGWRAWLDGQAWALRKWDGFLQAAPLPPEALSGRKIELRLRFTPTGWPFLPMVSALAWCAWLGWKGRLLA